jgi:hypothetical protein
MNFFEIYLPVAEVNANIIVLLFVGMITGMIAGLFGLGGGLIVIPYLLLSGVPVPVAIATATNQMTAGTVSSFIAYARNNRVDYKLAFIMLIGSIAGCLIGMQIFNYLSIHGKTDTVVPLIFLAILLAVTYTTTKDAIFILLKKHDTGKKKPLKFLCSLPLQSRFISCENTHSILTPIFIGITGGVLVSVVGIGGGFIMIPAMLYLLQCKEKYISGTTLFQIVFTSILSTILHSLTQRHIDIILAVILIFGTVFGAQVGSKIGTRIHPERYRLLLAGIIFFICIKFAYDIFISPNNAYQIIQIAK